MTWQRNLRLQIAGVSCVEVISRHWTRGCRSEIYKTCHQNPELSMLEMETGELVQRELKSLGFDEVYTNIGGHGVVGVLRNCRRNEDGPVVMLRADMDALPIQELTCLPYASTKRQLDRFGTEQPVMHACGHDFHVACLLAAADILFSARKAWSGTVICVFQPGEEDGAGARAMVRDGLFDKIPRPTVLLGQHVVPTKAGTVQIRAGAALSACDCFDVRLFGKGGHGSSPHLCRDPVLAACATVLRLQGIVSREVDPAQFAVVTCVYLHAGKAINIVPETVDMKVDVRTYDPQVRADVVAAVKRIIKAESGASMLPKEPEIKQTDDIPAIINNPRVVEKLTNVFRGYFSPEKISVMARDTASDDFSVFAEQLGGIPCAYWNFGGTDPDVWDRASREGKISELPKNHSAYFAPAVEPTLRTGTDAMALAALSFLDEA
ncbi:Zn-dependent exopeptidase [Naviculisporaceae sp. PSN 640]